MIIRIIKTIIYSIFWRVFFHNLNKIDFINILTNISNYLRALSIREQIRFIKAFFSSSRSEISAYTFLTKPIDFNLTVFIDTLSKKLIYLTIILSIVGFSWFNIFKKILLLPFKLGIFSFLYSIIGFDVTWFLKLFNLFPLNIPYWIYFQYLTLYNNWLNWWNNIVNVKSITSVPVKEIKNKLNINKNTIETENPDNLSKNNKKIWYVVGIVTLIVGVGFILWYFDVFNSDGSAGSGSGNRPRPRSELVTIRPRSTSNVDSIIITDNQSISTPSSSSNPSSSTPSASSVPSTNSTPPTNNDPVSSVNPELSGVERSKPSNTSNSVVNEMNQRMEALNSSSSSSHNPQSRTFNRFSVLDQLEQEGANSNTNRPDSPTGSTDSSETITPNSSWKSRGKTVLRRSSSLFKK